MPQTYGELFAGAGGLSRGLEAAGFACAAHAEIEPHARAVLRQHWPGVRLDGDVTQVNGADYRGITLLSGGSPCQDLSVAGKRKGLAGARSGLFHEQVRIWTESDAPYFLWENVLGALSSNAGQDFAVVLSTLVGAPIAVPRDGWSRGGVASGPAAVAAWRVLDLQHFGPPQRRVRVFVLAARAGGVDPAEVLALSEGVCGHPSPREQQRQGAAAGAGGGAEGGSDGRAINISNGEPRVSDTFATLQARANAAGIGSGQQMQAVLQQTIGIDQERNAQVELMGTLNTGSKTGGGQLPVVMAFDSYNQTASHVTSTLSHGESGRPIAFHHTQDPISGAVSPALGRTTEGMGVVCTTGDVTHALTHEGKSATEEGTGPLSRSQVMAVTQPTVVLPTLPAALANSATGQNRDELIIAQNSQWNAQYDHETAYTLNTMHDQQYLVKAEPQWPKPIADTLTVAYAEKWGLEDQHINGGAGLFQPTLAGRPRRLTPRECERLMSWPDDWTAVGVDEAGKAYRLSDTARYRLCGNGVGSVQVQWIAERLMAALRAVGDAP